MSEITRLETGVTSPKISLYERLHFRIISIVHETLYGIFVDPYPSLVAAGLAPGQSVLEVGCGPGFFTIPAAETVGPNGRVYALDFNAAAVQHVREKVVSKGLANIEVLQADASNTGLADQSIDVAFLFGVVHALKDLNSVLREMYRVLKKTGTLTVQSHWSESYLLRSFTQGGLFHLSGKERGIYQFRKDLVAADLQEHLQSINDVSFPQSESIATFEEVSS